MGLSSEAGQGSGACCTGREDLCWGCGMTSSLTQSMLIDARGSRCPSMLSPSMLSPQCPHRLSRLGPQEDAACGLCGAAQHGPEASPATAARLWPHP